MSTCSCCNVYVSVPNGTKTYDTVLEWSEFVEIGDKMGCRTTHDDRRLDTITDDLVLMFNGPDGTTPLNEIDGLYLDLDYENWDDMWDCTITICQGEVSVFETEMMWRKSSLEEIGISLG